MDQASFLCPQCRQPRLFQSKPVNHVVHLLASVFLCGLWLPIWIFIALSHVPTWRCSFCGFSDAQRYLADPDLRSREALAASAQRLEKERVAIERAGSSSQERIAFFFSDYRREIIGAPQSLLELSGELSLLLPLWKGRNKLQDRRRPRP